jgi:hypothetical protein
MTKQTAVNFLIQEIKNDMYVLNKSINEWNEIFEQAKEMEKEQILFAYNDGAIGAFENTYKGMHDYYKENYGGKNEI